MLSFIEYAASTNLRFHHLAAIHTLVYSASTKHHEGPRVSYRPHPVVAKKVAGRARDHTHLLFFANTKHWPYASARGNPHLPFVEGRRVRLFKHFVGLIYPDWRVLASTYIGERTARARETERDVEIDHAFFSQAMLARRLSRVRGHCRCRLQLQVASPVWATPGK